MGTTEIGALIVSLRSESAAFRAEMDKGRDAIKKVGSHAVLSTQQMSRFAAIAAEQVVPGLQGSRVAVEGLVSGLIRAQGAFALLGPAAAAVAAGLAGFALGNIIQNFQDAQKAGFSYVESLKLAVGLTKSYEQATKEASEAQKKFSANMAQARDIVRSFQKELATLREEEEKLFRIQEQEDRERIQKLPVAERAAAEAAAEEAQTERRRQARAKRQDTLLKTILEERDVQVKAWVDETKVLIDQLNLRLKARQQFESQLGRGGLPGAGLAQGLAATRDFSSQIGKEALDVAGLERLGRLTSRDALTERENIRARALAQAEELRKEFAGFPPVLDAIDRAVASIEFGNFGKEMEQARISADQLLATDQQLQAGLGQIANQLIQTVPSTEAAAKATAELTRAYFELSNSIYAAVNAKIAFDSVTVE